MGKSIKNQDILKVVHHKENIFWLQNEQGIIFSVRLIKNWKVNLRREPVGIIKELLPSLRCLKCGEKNNLTIDHEPPLSVKPWKSKIQILCVKCHLKKNKETSAHSTMLKSLNEDTV